MALLYFAGFGISATDQIVVAGTTVSLATARVCPVDMTSVTDPSGGEAYKAFAAVVQAAIIAQVGAGYTVTFSTSSGLYTIAKATNFTLADVGTGTLYKALGFNASHSGANTYTSDVRPYYVMIPDVDGRSQVSDVYEPDEITEEAVADDGTAVGTTRTTSELRSDWSQNFESKAQTMLRSATSAVPWTWEHFFQHVRMTHPFAVYDGSVHTCHQLRAEGTRFRPRRFEVDLDTYWNLDFMTRDLGLLP